MSEWAPEILGMKPDQSRLQMVELLNALSETRSSAFITHSNAIQAGNHNAAVGALREIRETIIVDAKLRQSLGLLSAEPIKIAQTVEMNNTDAPDFKAIFEDYGDVILDELHRRRLDADRGGPEPGDAEPVDTGSAPPGDGEDGAKP